MLEKKIEELGNYFDGVFPLKNNCNGVRVITPDTWSFYEKKTSDYTITPVKVIDDNKHKTLFIGTEKATITDIISFTIEVIINNIENETKKQLFQEKISELAKIFDSNQLSALRNIVFRFEKPKKYNKKNVNVGKSQDNEIPNDTLLIKDVNETKCEVDNKTDNEDDDIEAKINSAILKSKEKK